MKKFSLYLLLVALVISCSKTDEDVQDLGYDYFPLETGNYIIYTVTEVTYDDFNDTVITVDSLLKETVGKSFLDLEGRTVYKLNRYTKPNFDTVEVWNFKDVWTVYKGSAHAERTEGNDTFVNLTFPLKLGKVWDGNARNDSVSQDYTVLNYNFRMKIGGSTFNRTARINQWENINLIEEQLAEDIYARDVGLVQRVNRDVTIDPSDSTLGGSEFSWVYKEHGKE